MLSEKGELHFQGKSILNALFGNYLNVRIIGKIVPLALLSKYICIF